MASWDQARNELNREQAQEQAREKRHEKLVEDAAYKLVRVLDPKIKQFVQTLYDHNQCPTVSKEFRQKKKQKKGLLGILFEEKVVSKTVTEPSSTIELECKATSYRYVNADSVEDYRLIMFANQAWALTRFHRFADCDDPRSDKWGMVENDYPILKQTATGTQVTGRSELVSASYRDPSRVEPAINLDLDGLSSEFIKQMANYLIQRGLPLPHD